MRRGLDGEATQVDPDLAGLPRDEVPHRCGSRCRTGVASPYKGIRSRTPAPDGERHASPYRLRAAAPVDRPAATPPDGTLTGGPRSRRTLAGDGEPTASGDRDRADPGPGPAPAAPGRRRPGRTDRHRGGGPARRRPGGGLPAGRRRWPSTGCCAATVPVGCVSAPGVLHLARRAQPLLAEGALPALRRLAEQAGATAHLTVVEGGEAVALAVVEPSWTTFHVAYRTGSRHPLERGAAGRAILAGRHGRPGRWRAAVSCNRARTGWRRRCSASRPGGERRRGRAGPAGRRRGRPPGGRRRRRDRPRALLTPESPPIARRHALTAPARRSSWPPRRFYSIPARSEAFDRLRFQAVGVSGGLAGPWFSASGGVGGASRARSSAIWRGRWPLDRAFSCIWCTPGRRSPRFPASGAGLTPHFSRKSSRSRDFSTGSARLRGSRYPQPFP